MTNSCIQYDCRCRESTAREWRSALERYAAGTHATHVPCRIDDPETRTRALNAKKAGLNHQTVISSAPNQLNIFPSVVKTRSRPSLPRDGASTARARPGIYSTAACASLEESGVRARAHEPAHASRRPPWVAKLNFF
jgi:hypothetical protein